MDAGTALTFPPNFLWGFATSSYQIEGAHDADGKGESIWDRFCRGPGNIMTGETGDVACDHYHRWHEDLDLMASLDASAYRLSLSWPRILPDGDGAVNAAGIAFYDRLIDGLLERGIEPFVTLYHWDLPQVLQDRGGWPSRDTVDAFIRYTEVAVEALGDRVKRWATLNEPWVSSIIGYQVGMLAPGHQDLDEALAAAHHLLLAHGRAVPIIKAVPGAECGISLSLFQVEATTEEGLPEARMQDGTMNRWFLDPIAGRGYPDDVVEGYGRDMSVVRPGDLDAIAAPIDFLGVNYYMRDVVDGRGDGPRTALDWEIYPEGLTMLLERLNKDYPFPSLYITENGACFNDVLEADGSVHDPERIDYLREHFAVVQRAIASGIPLRGYFVWTFMDNFEWNHGTSARFGVVYVDFPTQRRIVKDSGRFCSSVFGAAGRSGQVVELARPDAG